MTGAELGVSTTSQGFQTREARSLGVSAVAWAPQQMEGRGERHKHNGREEEPWCPLYNPHTQMYSSELGSDRGSRRHLLADPSPHFSLPRPQAAFTPPNLVVVSNHCCTSLMLYAWKPQFVRAALRLLDLTAPICLLLPYRSRSAPKHPSAFSFPTALGPLQKGKASLQGQLSPPDHFHPLDQSRWVCRALPQRE